MESLSVDTSKTWTAEEYLQLEENPNQQLLNGHLIMSPSPSLQHQKIIKILHRYLDQYALNQGDETYFAPLDVHLDKTNVPQPDLVYIKKENLNKLSQRGIEGAPDLIVEIISPSNSYLDRYEKKDLYRQFEVKEYWIVDPGNATLEIYQLVREEYKLAQYLVGKGKITSPLLPEFSLNLGSIFEDKKV
ncbi:MAG: Uma2 family endonuclease [Cyclobacteriaceae bacterium]